MSRYSGWTNSKSLNARQAEREGRFPATAMVAMLRAKGLFAGVTSGDILAAVDTVEWHHVGRYAAEIKYFGLGDIFACRRALRARIATRRAAPKPQGQRYRGCTVTWLEWVGTRAHPRALEFTASGVEVTVKNRWATVHLVPGAELRRTDTKTKMLVAVPAPRDVRKSLDARGFALAKGWPA
jgi:hypothetical protein